MDMNRIHTYYLHGVLYRAAQFTGFGPIDHDILAWARELSRPFELRKIRPGSWVIVSEHKAVRTLSDRRFQRMLHRR